MIIKKNVVIVILISSLLVVGFSTFLLRNSNKVEIKTETISNAALGGEITEGTNMSPEKGSIQTDARLVFESREIETGSDTANSAVVKWEQTSSKSETAGFQLQARTNNGGAWSDWVDATNSEDRKDGTSIPHNALILADTVKKIQYRFVLTGDSDNLSPQVNLDKVSIELIDASKGPSLEGSKKTSFVSKLFGKAGAKAEGPYIYNRAQWGSPEAYGSPDWPPEYEPLHRVVVHHTATTSNGDSFAAMRSIWHFQRYTRGWGDIGYNYVVDPWGNIFQGRYYDYNEADSSNADVVGAHALNNNRGTSGIAVLGNYATKAPPNEVFYSVARLAAFKAAPYDFNPAASSWFGPHLVGHRDVGQTACPGQRFYDRIQEVRNLANIYYPAYNSMEHLDYLYRGQGFNNLPKSNIMLWPNTGGTAFIDVQNNGTETWSNSGFGAVMLGTNNPRDRRSSFCDSTWLGPNCDRPATFYKKVLVDQNGDITIQNTNSIAPGEIARFEFAIKAPMQGGKYKEHLNLLSAGRSWFLNDRGMYFDFNIPDPFYSWQWQSQGIFTNSSLTMPVNPNNLRQGDRVYFHLTAKNTGNQPWTRSEANPVRLATNRPNDRYSWLCDPTWVNNIHCNRAAVLNENTVEPGQNGTFGFWGVIPYAGEVDTMKREYFNLTAESKAWMNNVNQYWEFTVKNP